MVTREQRLEISRLHAAGVGVNEIARRLRIWSGSVRWALNREDKLSAASDKRRAQGCGTYRCGHCHEYGHNVRSCPELENEHDTSGDSDDLSVAGVGEPDSEESGGLVQRGAGGD